MHHSYLLLINHRPDRDHMTITVPPCDSLKPERHNMQQILEVTEKMMELLTGEVSGAGNSGTFSSNRQGMCLDGVGVFRRTQGS
ncbi:unnamed protein product, partial [Staurois parvus]